MKRGLMILLCSSLLLVWSCSSKVAKKHNVSIVKVENAEAYSKTPTAIFPGKIMAGSDVNMAFKVSGTILKTPVNEGEFVRKGQLLAEIDPRDYRIQLSATEAEYKKIKGEAERVIQLYKKQSVSKNDYDKAVYGLQQITAKYDAHKNALADTRMIAPFDGYVQKIIFDANETVSAGMPVVSMINTTRPEVEINIPSLDYLRRSEFKSFYCEVDVYPNVRFPLEFVSINKKANLNQLYTTHFMIKKVEGVELPTPGMTTNVTINYKITNEGKVKISNSSLFFKEDKPTVWIYDAQNKKVCERVVEVGQLLKDGKVVINKGIDAGESVVSAGVNTLKDGQQVELLPNKGKFNVGGML